MDEATIALQEKTKRDFLDPLSWDLLPAPAILATIRAVLLLFNVPLSAARPSHHHRQSDQLNDQFLDDEETWRARWGLWIVKNIDSHTRGWEWSATNEPVGLFTKPYALCPDHLQRVQSFLEIAIATPDAQRCWQSMPAYRCLKNWAVACYEYVHMRHHCLPGFPAFTEIQKVVAPPQRSSPANVWFRCEMAEGIAYFYNRLEQTIRLDQPPDFDGAHVKQIPLPIQELIQEALANDPASRLELERRSRQRALAQLLAEDEWIECVDFHTQKLFYYSLKHYRVAETAPPNGAYISHTESVAYKAVLQLQASYRNRRLQKKLLVRKAKRSSLPAFAAMTNKSTFY